MFVSTGTATGAEAELVLDLAEIETGSSDRCSCLGWELLLVLLLFLIEATDFQFLCRGLRPSIGLDSIGTPFNDLVSLAVTLVSVLLDEL